MLQIPDVTDPVWFLVVTAIIFGIVVGRYLLIAGIFHLSFYFRPAAKWKQRKISTRAYKSDQFKREVRWSTITSLLFGVTGTIGILLWQKGFLKVYTDVNEYSLWWIPVSLVTSLALHETYYYWLHRWMHRPGVFKIIHKVHHDSNITSAWTAFSFHPIEGLLQAVFLPALLLILPMHIYVLLFQLTLMTLSSVINHLDIELYPRNFHRHFIGKWLIGATHHSLHHKQFKTNYGLYFTFWDKLKKTESENYERLFEEKTTRPVRQD